MTSIPLQGALDALMDAQALNASQAKRGKLGEQDVRREADDLRILVDRPDDRSALLDAIRTLAQLKRDLLVIEDDNDRERDAERDATGRLDSTLQGLRESGRSFSCHRIAALLREPLREAIDGDERMARLLVPALPRERLLTVKVEYLLRPRRWRKLLELLNESANETTAAAVNGSRRKTDATGTRDGRH